MAYDPTNWTDGENKYSITDQAGNVILGFENIKLLYAGIGGTPLSQEKMNKIEQGIVTHEETAATETLASHVELATQGEITTGTDTGRVVTPATLKGLWTHDFQSSDNLKASLDTALLTTNAPSYIKKKQFTINATGTFRVKFTLRTNASGGASVYGRIYKNGVAFGTERLTTSTIGAEYSEDLVFSKGDTCELWTKYNDVYNSYVSNFRIYFDIIRILNFDITLELPADGTDFA